MKMNTRFPVALHILALLGLNALNRRRTITSEIMAHSVQTNPVVVRRIMTQLKKAGLIETHPGVGGTHLIKKPAEITLLDVFNAVAAEGDTSIFDVHPNPNPRCYIGAHIHEALAEPFDAAQKAMENSLAQYTLLDVMRPIAEKNNMVAE